MNPERWERLQVLFEGAAQLPPEEQRRFIEQRAGGDAELSDQVLRMLERDAKASFLDLGVHTIAGDIFDTSEVQPLQNAGPYRLLEQLGSGGMGLVYLAERPDWESGKRPFKVALKIPRDVWISSDRLRRFYDEQRLLAQLVHPGIARIYDAGTLAGSTPWFAMEYVDGQPITRYSEAHSCSAHERLRLVLEVCDAVEYAHRQTIVHRDLKPSNILVTTSQNVKLLDFGIAKQIDEAGSDSTVTRLGLQPMTLAYAAPEQILENSISTQTDVYSIGVLLYELLTGRLPFDPSDLKVSSSGESIRHREPGRPSLAAGARSQGEWADLDVLILTAMHNDLTKRYPSVAALRRDIEHFLRNEPLEAHADSFGYRAGKFLQRRRWPVGTSTAVVLLLISLITFYTVRLARARDAALAEAKRTRLARQFTQDLLEGANPEEGPSRDLKVIDLLDPGLAKAKLLKDDPVQQAELLTTLGSLFVNFGEFAKGDAALHSAYRLLDTAGATHSHEFAEVFIQLGLMYTAEDQFEHALSCMRRGLAIEEQIVPPDASLIYQYKTGVAFVLAETRPREAIPILTALLKETSPAIDQESQSDVWSVLSTSYLNIGEYEKAEPFAQRVLTYTRQTRAPNNPSIAVCLVNLAMIQNHLEQYSAREKTLREALAIDQAWYPKDHGETGDIMRMLAETLLYEKRFSEAAGLARQALSIEQRAYGNGHKRYAYALQTAGRAELSSDNLDQAETDFQAELPVLRSLNDANNLPLVFSFLGDVYLAKREYRQAVEAYRQSLALFPGDVLDHSRQLASTRRNLTEAEGHLASAKHS